MISITGMALPPMMPTVSSRPFMYFSTSTASSQAKAAFRASEKPSSLSTMAVPTDEPPEQGLTTQGKPTEAKAVSPRRSVMPGGVGTPAFSNITLVSSLFMARALPI